MGLWQPTPARWYSSREQRMGRQRAASDWRCNNASDACAADKRRATHRILILYLCSRSAQQRSAKLSWRRLPWLHASRRPTPAGAWRDGKQRQRSGKQSTCVNELAACRPGAQKKERRSWDPGRGHHRSEPGGGTRSAGGRVGS